MHITRYLKQDIIASLQPGRATVILGARRVGKTTLLQEILQDTKQGKHSIYLNCDDPDVRTQLTNASLSTLQHLLSPYSLIILDEAQRIPNIGLTAKLIIDELSDKQLIISGSSSLDLANTITEPLTGRKKSFHLYPISILELANQSNQPSLSSPSSLIQILRYGLYPDVLSFETDLDRESYLLELSHDYLYKDVLEYQLVRNPEQLRKLLTALALQIGQEVSLSELGNLVGIDQKTVNRYLDLLEKSYVIFRLPALSRNLRKEIGKSRKIYFYDLGIRNALIKNFNTYDLRSDLGHVWENFLITERLKRDNYQHKHKNYYFWRTYDQKEIDLIEESSGKLTGFEFKWNSSSPISQPDFLAAYPDSTLNLVSQANYLDFTT